MNGVGKKIEQELKKEIKNEQKAHRKSSQPSSEHEGRIEPPKFHRDMRLICDVFRITEQTRYALRSHDAATLEDFSLMTDEDFADMIVAQACDQKPLPPLQQRKLSVLLSWVRSLPVPAATDESETTAASSPLNKASLKKESNAFIPADWEKRFYEDLPRLRRDLRQMGGKGQVSNWATEFLSLRWLFCG